MAFFCISLSRLNLLTFDAKIPCFETKLFRFEVLTFCNLRNSWHFDPQKLLVLTFLLDDNHIFQVFHKKRFSTLFPSLNCKVSFHACYCCNKIFLKRIVRASSSRIVFTFPLACVRKRCNCLAQKLQVVVWAEQQRVGCKRGVFVRRASC